MAFITTKEQLKAANSSLTVNLEIKSLKSFLDDAESDFRNKIGFAAFNELEGKTTLQAHKTMGFAIVNLALFYYADSGQLLISDSGMHVTKSPSLLPASDKKIVSFKKGVAQKAWKDFEFCIQLLEQNLTDFPIWEASTERKEYISTFISFSNIFNDYSAIKVTAELFQYLRSEVRNIEEDCIQQVLGKDLHTDFKAKDPSTYNDEETELLRRIRKVIAPLAFANFIPYNMVEFSPTGNYQLSQAAQAENIEVKSTASARALQRTMNHLLIRGDSELESLRVWMNKNTSAFAQYKKQAIAPMVEINEDLRDTGFYYM